jgi:ribosomal subunit interface protein
MDVPLVVSYRNVNKTDDIEDLIRDKAAKLEQFCDHITSCRVAVEKVQQHQNSGNPFRVRIDMKVPPGHEIVAKREPSKGDLHDPLDTVIRKAFAAARKELEKVTDKQSGRVKWHPEQQVMGYVFKLFEDDDYGFIKTPDDREIYFHKNAVLNGDFERLKVGTGVRFHAEDGEKGPQATSVEIIYKPGAPFEQEGVPEV